MTAGQPEPTLPPEVRRLFWECDPDAVDLNRHRDFLIGRVLGHGDWEAIQWLRRTLGDPTLRDWFLRKSGGRLDSRRLRFWGLILDLPRDLVDEWVAAARASIWERRRRA